MLCSWPKTEPPAGGGGCGIGLGVGYLHGFRGDEVEYSKPEPQGSTYADLGVSWAESYEDWPGSWGHRAAYCCMELAFENREDMDLVDRGNEDQPR